ncbi:LytTR family DNA-binding domain-containing protein [Pelagibius sp. 7325]|uniref:LytTR family DNA-binding domain-containing protein n=1 Tax=Pelagibius sp. 7325 TaxID=3131994 RepID=UPI0030EEE248
MILRGAAGSLPWPLWGLAVTLVAAILLGGHQREALADFPLVAGYAYWIGRLLMAYLLFAGALALLELSPLTPQVKWPWLVPAAALLTLPLFTLCVTMLDLLLGLPELNAPEQSLWGAGAAGFGLDASGATYSAGAMAALFALESLYHLDNHLALCALIVAPRLILQGSGSAKAVVEESPAAAPRPQLLRPAPPAPPAFLARFDPPVTGPLFAVQAQEHYVRAITAEGAPTTLYRFGDALRELDGLSGLQVHRSFWVADAGVAALKSGKRGLRIVLRNGEQVPVSARHADDVQRRYGARLDTVA